MRSSRASILLACASAWTAPARLARVLARGGARVVALTAPGRALAATRFVDRVVDAPVELEAYVDALHAHLEAERYAWVICTDDPLLGALRARRHEHFAQRLLPIASDHAWAECLASKAAFCELGRADGLPIPDSRVCHSRDDARRAIAALGVPVMLKQSNGFAGLGVRLVRDPGELDAAWEALASDQAIVAQRFVDGPIGHSVFLMDHGRPICWYSARKVRTFPGPFGPSSARRFTSHAEVAPLLTLVGALTDYHGFGALDWVLGADGHLHVIELNARPVPGIHMAPAAGVDFSRAVRGLLAGAPTVQAPPEMPADAPIHPMFPEDLQRSLVEGSFELADWRPRRGFTDVPWHDPRLLAFHVASMARAARDRRPAQTAAQHDGASDGDLSVTARYTAQAWIAAGVANAGLYAHPDAERVFAATNLALRAARRFRPSLPVLRCSLAQRHAMIDTVVRESGARQLLELAAGLSPRGATFSRDPELTYVDLDLPGMIAEKRALLARTDEGREVLARPNYALVAGDVRVGGLAAHLPPGQPSCVVAEGLLMYLEATEQRALWAEIATALRASGGTFVFDLTPGPEEPRPGFAGTALRALMKRFTGGQSFREDRRSRAEIITELAAAGFDRICALEPAPLLAAWKLPYPDEPTQVVLFRCRVDAA